MDLNLIYNNPDPSGGGIPRYAYRLLNGLKNKGVFFKEVDMTPVYGENILEKLYNCVIGRKKYLGKQEFAQINHFLQPELYFHLRRIRDKFNIVTIHDLVMIRQEFWDRIFKSITDPNSWYQAGRQFLIKRRYKNALNHGDHYIVPSRQTRDELKELGVKGDKITVINHGINPKFKYKTSWDNREPVIGYLNSFYPRKRPLKLLDDWRWSSPSNTEFSLKMAGVGGTMEREVKEKSKEVYKVSWLGKIPEEELVDYYNSLKAFIAPTSYEGFGLTPLEATACGTPTFIYEDARITPEVRQFCYEIKSVAEVPEILSTLSESNIRKKAKTIKQQFKWEDSIKKHIKVYKTIKERGEDR